MSSLKEFERQITLKLNNEKGYINLKDGNLILDLSLIDLVDTINPFSLKLFFNYSTVDTSIFGYGANLNLYNNIYSTSTTQYTKKTSSGEIYYYDLIDNKFECIENKEVITESTNEIILTDRFNNKSYYDNNFRLYPYKIEENDGKIINIDIDYYNHKINYIDNNYYEKLSFNYTNNLVSSIYYYKKAGNVETLLYKIMLSYTNNKISSIIVLNSNNEVIKNISINISNDIIIKDNISRESLKFILTNNKVTSYAYGYNDDYSHYRCDSIEYYNNYTKYINCLGEYKYYNFDNYGFLLYEIDDKGVLKSYEYDVLKKKITYESSATYYLENDLINNESINNYDNYNLNITSYTETNIRYINYFNPNVNRVSGTGKISKTFNIKDISNETYKLIMAIKEEVSYSEIHNVKVRIYLDSDYEEKTLKKYPIDDEYNILTIDITSKKTFNNIKIEIELMSSSIIIGGIKLYKGMPGSYYSYDLKNNLTKIRNGLYNKKYIYNSEGNLIKEVGIKGEYSEAKYSTGKITEVITSTGIIESYVYLSDETKRLSLKSKNFSSNNDELETSYTYSDRFLSFITDENQITTSYEYDIYGKLTTISEQSTNIWSNRLNVYYDYNLDDTKNSITKEYNNVEYKKVIKSYNDEKDIIYATLKNSSNYSINYIDKKLSNVFINGYKIEDIIYDNYDRIESKTNGNNNYRYSFIYDSLDNISEIKYDNSLRYKYEYDNYNNILNIKDRYLNILESYEYDDEKNIVGISLNGIGNKISYEYEYGKLNYKEIKLDGNERYYLYDGSLSDTIFHNLGGIITTNELYYGSIFSNGIELEKNEMYITPKKIDESNVVTSHTKYQNKDSIYLGSSVEYGININNGNKNKVFISYCFYYSTISSNRRYLFSVIEEDTYIKSYIDNNSNIIVEVKEHNKTSETLITSVNNLNLNSWNSFILNFKTNSNGCECILIINDKVSTYTSSNYYDVYFMSDIKYHIGYNYENGVTYPINMYITGLIIGFSDINIDETIKIKKAYSDYVIGNSSLETELINTTCHIPELNNSLVYNIFPFLNSFKSLSNTEPKELDVRFVTNDYINNFIYDSDAKRNVLKLDGNKVIYDFDTSNYLRLIAKIKLINSGYKRYIYELKSTNNNLLGLYVNNINKLCISYNNNVYETNIYLNSGLIYTLDLKISISSSTICYIKIDENTTYSCVINNTSIISPTVSIGRKHNPEYIINGILGEYSEVYPLNGIIYNMYKTTESMYLDINFINGYSYNLTYDAFERIKNKECRSKNIISLSHSYTYKESTRLINKEYITYNNQVKERTYSYDLKGYITNISDTTFGSHSYTYNYLGELTRDNNKYYTYDTNGNILTAGNNTYTYDSVIKDRLISVNNNPISYNNSYPLNPTRYKGLTYQYEGKRLIRVSEYDGYEYIDYDFTYNDRGLLIKYDIYHSYDDDTDSWDEIVEYFYENDILISEVSDNSRTDYLYDAANNLYGFIRNDTNVYYYIKDITNNIIGIVDENSNLVVKYDYDAYGNIISKTGTLKNSLMYKGYLYISELGMYYCKSRFYVIEWNRFLNGDSINYLDYDNIDSLNLFSYCYNNPVMYSDGDGSFPILTLILAGTFALGFGSSLFMNAATNKWQLDWRDFLQAGVDGAFAVGATMLAMTGIGFAGSIAAGAAMGWSQYVIGAGIQGDSITLVGSLTAIGIGALGGAISGAGAANSANIGKNMIGLSDDGVRAIGAITNAANRKAAGIISAKGLQSTFNLYGKTAFNAVQAAIPGTMRRLFLSSARKIAFYTVLANASQSGLNYGYKAWGLI